MTYAGYHLVFNLPACLLLLFLVRNRLRCCHLAVIAAVATVAFLATAPWDNYAVHLGIWDFDWNRTTPVEVDFRGVTWRLPLEEYAFFVIEVVVVGLLTVLFLPAPPENSPGGSRPPSARG